MRTTPVLLAGLCAALLSPFARSADSPAATLVIHADQPGAVISPNLYGQFTEHLGRCVYEGIWVEPDSKIPNVRGIRSDVVAALKQIKVPQVRWPGGCFADEYHWRDGIGPRESRPSMINTHWGGVVENNHFGTHEFLDFCEQIGAEPYICLNVGSGTVQEAMEWVEYMTSDADSPMANLRRKNGREKPWKVHYLAIGNESWGCGGNMTPQFYADNYRRYNTFVKNYDRNDPINRIACGPNAENYEWTETLMKAGGRMNGLALHYYTLPSGSWQGSKGSATQFGEDQYFATLRNTLKMEELITRHSAIMDKYDPQKHVGLVIDEWGIWTDVEPGTNPGFLYQQNSLRDAILAAINLNLFQAHADRISMANIAQMINVLQSMILTDKEKMLRTPTYHVFDMFKVHQGATSLGLQLVSPDYVLGANRIPAVSASASRDAAGKIHVSLANADPKNAVALDCRLTGVAAKSVSGTVLTAPDFTAHNTFDQPDAIAPKVFNGATVTAGGLNVTLPAKSVVVLELL
ncbi:MAG TPA: alpha-N-arabinofuranosidase [Opitutaceae bacterium]|nr:alpha-N-arabinofuranosidase [Opitutaceae bacterium]